jgi:hypothetical protein
VARSSRTRSASSSGSRRRPPLPPRTAVPPPPAVPLPPAVPPLPTEPQSHGSHPLPSGQHDRTPEQRPGPMHVCVSPGMHADWPAEPPVVPLPSVPPDPEVACGSDVDRSERPPHATITPDGTKAAKYRASQPSHGGRIAPVAPSARGG